MFCPINDSSNLKRGAYIGEEDFIASPNKMARIEEPKRGIAFSFEDWIVAVLVCLDREMDPRLRSWF